MAANLIKDSVAQHHGSLVLGPISKGLKGQTFASEMGDQMVNAVDREIQWRQRLGFSVAHKIAGFMITHPIIWEMIEEVLNSKDRIMIQERFYTYFERLCADKRIAAEIEKLPAFIKSEEEQYRKDPNYVWLPQRQPKKVRDTIVANQAKLKVAYDEYQKQNAADVAADVAAEAAAELEVADPAEQAAELKSAIPPCLLGWKSKNVAPAAEADVPAEAKAEADKGAKPARKGLLGFLGW
jgi:hypothetical protein